LLVTLHAFYYQKYTGTVTVAPSLEGRDRQERRFITATVCPIISGIDVYIGGPDGT